MTAEANARKAIVEAATEDTEMAISLLVEGFDYDSEEIDEMGCSEIFEKVEEEIKDSDWNTLKDAVIFSDIDDSLIDI